MVFCLENRICRVYYLKSRVCIDDYVQTFKYIESKVCREYLVQILEYVDSYVVKEQTMQRVEYREIMVQYRINHIFCMIYGLRQGVSNNARNGIGRF